MATFLNYDIDRSEAFKPGLKAVNYRPGLILIADVASILFVLIDICIRGI